MLRADFPCCGLQPVPNTTTTASGRRLMGNVHACGVQYEKGLLAQTAVYIPYSTSSYKPIVCPYPCEYVSKCVCLSVCLYLYVHSIYVHTSVCLSGGRQPGRCRTSWKHDGRTLGNPCCSLDRLTGLSITCPGPGWRGDRGRPGGRVLSRMMALLGPSHPVRTGRTLLHGGDCGQPPSALPSRQRNRPGARSVGVLGARTRADGGREDQQGQRVAPGRSPKKQTVRRHLVE